MFTFEEAKKVAEDNNMPFVKQYALEGFPRWVPWWRREGIIAWENPKVDMNGRPIKKKAQ